MFKSLRMRLAISHVLPVIVIAPIVTFVLVYLLETQYFLSNFASELIVQADLVQQFVRDDNSIWQSQTAAEKLVHQLKKSIPARLMLLDGEGRLLSSSLATDQSRVGTIIEMPVVIVALQGQSTWLTDYNPFIGEQVVDVAVPVKDSLNHVIGIIRLSHDLRSIVDRLNPVSALIFISLLIAVILAVILGLLLAQSLSAPLRQLAQAVTKLTPSSRPEILPENGPTEVKTLASSFNQLSERLYKLEQSRQALLASFVHELGTPLGAIKAAAHALQEGAAFDPELGQDLAEGISVEVDQLRRLLDDLALLGETQLRTPILEFRPVHIGEIVETVCRAYAYLVKQKNIKLDYETDAQLPIIQADSARLHQIVSNLIHNAYKYTPSGGWIEVRVSVEKVGENPNFIIVTITDNGPGISDIEQKSIFKMFYRSPELSGGQQGMGIGLALAQQIAFAHGGGLDVKSRLGMGAQFILRLPIN